MKITLADSKKIHLNQLQLLGSSGSQPLIHTIRNLGHIQIDSMFVVARSQDLVLHCRDVNYSEENVWPLLENGKIFEEFAHARSLIPMGQFPFYYRKMIDRREINPKWFANVDNAEELITSTLEMIEEKGEITTSDVDLGTNTIKSRWSGLNKRILDYLALRGYVTVCRRENFSTIYYTLIDNHIDAIPEIDELPNRMEVFWNEVDNNLDILGLAPVHRVLHYTYANRRFSYNSKSYTPSILMKQALSEGKYNSVKIGNTQYIFHKNKTFDELLDMQETAPSVSILSPFDNSLWSRESLKDQYNFDYKMEIYVPKEKRQYGFFAMPILFGIDFVGRVDVKLDRSNNKMNFIGWYWEKDFKPDSTFWDELNVAIEQFLQFHKCDKYDLGDMKKSYRKEVISRIAEFDIT